ncbi:PLP-dependent aminotransferase family protein, partial [Streptomyces sp. SID4982]|uniref:aminotransferase class I/II-fold pyridoxal phosphate-dependent enzyme n=1 Tax=Streptomyces sp. SID4982 TaxID=2690291 RepID=UPI00136F34D9|nr:GntR family transcriptional regulator [Streptomyces sp. SID4982]
MSDYRSVADAVAEEIRSGTLRPGDRLPPQRTFARRHGIAGSTATRVYRELARRGLTVGEVGRGTFVRAGAESVAPALTEPAAARIDLELNHPALPGHTALLAEGLAPLTRPDILGEALRPVGAAGTPAAREAAADLLARGGWRPDPGQVLFAGNGRQAVSAAVAALVPPGGRLGVEELTYPVIRTVAARLGVTLVPLAMDDAGLVPDAVEQAHRRAPLHAVYTQPTLHNPLSLTAPPARTAALAEVLTRLGLSVVEDAVWGFLCGELPPLAALLPERTVLVDSLSKRVAPGLTLGFLAAPPARTADLATALRSGGWTPMRFALEVMRRWQRDGTADTLAADKRRDAVDRQALAARRLAGFDVRGDARAYHCWWRLPEGWRA